MNIPSFPSFFEPANESLASVPFVSGPELMIPGRLSLVRQSTIMIGQLVEPLIHPIDTSDFYKTAYTEMREQLSTEAVQPVTKHMLHLVEYTPEAYSTHTILDDEVKPFDQHEIDVLAARKDTEAAYANHVVISDPVVQPAVQEEAPVTTTPQDERLAAIRLVVSNNSHPIEEAKERAHLTKAA